MLRLCIALALVGCTSKGLPLPSHAAQADGRVVRSSSGHVSAHETLLNESEPARIGPPAGNGAGRRSISARDDVPSFEPSRERLAEMDSAPSLHRK